MKQIKFNPELIGKPGITVKVDDEVPDFVKWYPLVHTSQISFVYPNGTADSAHKDNPRLTMYRSIRSAEEIAKEFYDKEVSRLMFIDWNHLGNEARKVYTALVQSGIDEVTNKNE